MVVGIDIVVAEPPLVALAELRPGLFHEQVQLVHIDIRQEWTYPGALRRATVGLVLHPVLQIPGPEQLPNQVYESLVLYPSFQNVDQDVVVDVVETPFDVALHKPADAGEGFLYLRQGGMTAFSGPKTMRCALKGRFIDAF